MAYDNVLCNVESSRYKFTRRYNTRPGYSRVYCFNCFEDKIPTI